MIQLLTVVYTYLVPVIGLLFMFSLIKVNHLFNKQQRNLFMLITVVNLILIVTTSVDFIISTSTYDHLWGLRRFTSFINFAFGPIIPLLLLTIFKQKKNSFLLYIPIIINILVCFMSIFFEIVYFITSENKYSRGPLFFLPLATTVLYLCLMLIKPDDFHRQGRKTERYFMVVFILLTLVGAFLEIVVRLFCVTYGISAISLIAFYTLKNIHYFMVDPLTGAYNRQMYQQTLSKADHSYSCIAAYLDINNFKDINDTYGHDEGDKALILFANVLHRHLEGTGCLYRIGGDEFAVLSHKADIVALESALQRAQAELLKNRLSFAYGLAEYNDTDGDLQDVLHLADAAMYENKATMKSINEISE